MIRQHEIKALFDNADTIEVWSSVKPGLEVVNVLTMPNGVRFLHIGAAIYCIPADTKTEELIAILALRNSATIRHLGTSKKKIPYTDRKNKEEKKCLAGASPAARHEQQ